MPRTAPIPRRAPTLLKAVALAMVAVLTLQSSAEALEATVAPPVHLIDRVSGVQPTSAARRLLVNAHNAGDTATTAARSRASLAGMLEIDVSWNGTTLVAAHTLLPSMIGQDTTKLGQAWVRTSGFATVLLDIKTRSRQGLAAVVRFTDAHRGRPTYLSTPDWSGLRLLHAGTPSTRALLSLTNAVQLRQLLAGDHQVPGLAGVSAKDSLLTRPVVDALRDRHLLVQAYSVNTMDRVDQLASWGATGITTDNLAIMRALASPASTTTPRTSER